MAGKRKPGRPPAADPGPPTRGLLLDAAARVFAERGYAGASVDRIARAARVNKAIASRRGNLRRRGHARAGSAQRSDRYRS